MQLLELLRLLVTELERLQVRYLVTGSMATFAYGVPRLPHDIDVVVELPAAKFAALRAAFAGYDFQTSPEAGGPNEARERGFTFREPESNLNIDVIVATDSAYDESRLQCGQRLSVLGGTEILFASPEDVIVKKLEWYWNRRSEKHLRDIADLLRVRGDRIDRAYITEWADRLGLTSIWQLVLPSAHVQNRISSHNR